MPGSSVPLDRELIGRERLEPLLRSLGGELGAAQALGGVAHSGHANDLFEIHLDDGRVLMVKRARTGAAQASFDTARTASRLLREEQGIVAPRHLELPPDATLVPTLAYWRIPLPTLDELWPALSDAERMDAMRSWGALVQRIHLVRLPGHGPLLRAIRGGTPWSAFLGGELIEGVRATFAREWAEGLAALETLERTAPLATGGGDQPASLLHNDLHMCNLFCEREDGRVRCVGVLDLEAAYAGPPEADLARPLILYGPDFGDLPDPFRDALLEGYDRPLDPQRVRFFRGWHLLNIGLHCVRRGLHDFAAGLAQRAEGEAAALARSRPSRVA